MYYSVYHDYFGVHYVHNFVLIGCCISELLYSSMSLSSLTLCCFTGTAMFAELFTCYYHQRCRLYTFQFLR